MDAPFSRCAEPASVRQTADSAQMEMGGHFGVGRSGTFAVRDLCFEETLARMPSPSRAARSARS
ncbi:Uncharacterized protein DAT39_005730 [Clarias magur]|uniref:Uncharacterized protein n=1 Tax=Clarias magur TaxID=1594786 RepID=A0A8J4UQT2_CLAMG|nr:Uncharacterized protein DAT39_005730 [Clarias magur]